MSFECDVCHKMYKHYTSYEKHIESHFMETTNPNSTILFLLKKIEKLEQQVKDNTAYIQKERRKINIIEYLNGQPSEKIPNFKHYVKNIEATHTDLKEYLKEPPVTGLCKLLISIFQKDDQIPIRCFTGKKNVLFIKEDNTWFEMSDTYEIEILINKIQCKLLVLYEKQTKTREESGQDIFRHYFEDKQKILLNTYTGDTIYKRIQRHIWESIKEELVQIQ